MHIKTNSSIHWVLLPRSIHHLMSTNCGLVLVKQHYISTLIFHLRHTSVYSYTKSQTNISQASKTHYKHSTLIKNRKRRLAYHQQLQTKTLIITKYVTDNCHTHKVKKLKPHFHIPKTPYTFLCNAKMANSPLKPKQTDNNHVVAIIKNSIQLELNVA